MKYARLIKFSAFLLAAALTALLAGAVFGADKGEIDIAGELSFSFGTGRRDSVLLSETELNAMDIVSTVPAEYREVLQNDKFILLFDEKTAAVALFVKETGEVWFSNPTDADSEGIVSGREKDALKAQLLITYYDESGREDKQNSYTDSVLNEKMTYETENDTLTVSYQFGKIAVSLSEIPVQISRERFEGVLEKLSEDSKKALKAEYSPATLNGAEGDFRASLIEKYKNIENNDIYFLKYTSDHIVEKVKKLFDEAGYTPGEVAFDYDENKLEHTENIAPYFKARLSYKLDEKGLAVTLDSKSIEYNPKIPPYRVHMLEYFLSGNKDDKGYMLVPDGSGSLITLNNGKSGEASFEMPVFGENTAKSLKNRPVVNNKASLPVFGIKKGPSAMLAVIEDGQAMASVSARVSGMENEFNTVFPKFIFEDYDVVSLFSNATSVLKSKLPYSGVYKIHYQPLQPGSGYSEMAGAYRKRLIASGVLTQKSIADKYPLMVELAGSVPTGNKSLFSGNELMCSFADAKKIVESLTEELEVPLKIRYSGWDSTGLYPDLPENLKFGSMGNKNDFNALFKFCRQTGNDLFMSVNAGLYEKGPRSFGIKGLDKDSALRFRYNIMNGYRQNDTAIYQLSPRYIPEKAENLLKKTENFGFGALAVDDLPGLLYADYNTKTPYGRQESMTIFGQSLTSLSEKMPLMASNPNAYALNMLSFIGDLPVSDSGFRISDASVPFYQMVIRGFVDYSGPSLTFSADYKTALLNCVEYGAVLNYTLTARDTSRLKNTEYQYINRGRYDDWQEIIKADYAEAAAVLNEFQGQNIISHEKLMKDIFKTTYESGRSVYVNYGESSAEIGGIKIEAKGWCAQ